MVEEYKDRVTKLMADVKPAPLDVRALADKLGISYQAVRKVVVLGGRFGRDNHAKVAALFGVSPEWLASGKGEKRPAKPSGRPGAPESDVAARIREEREADPYELIERGLAGLIIVGKAKDNVMQQIREYAEIAADTQKALDERWRQGAKK